MGQLCAVGLNGFSIILASALLFISIPYLLGTVGVLETSRKDQCKRDVEILKNENWRDLIDILQGKYGNNTSEIVKHISPEVLKKLNATETDPDGAVKKLDNLVREFLQCWIVLLESAAGIIACIVGVIQLVTSFISLLMKVENRCSWVCGHILCLILALAAVIVFFLAVASAHCHKLDPNLCTPATHVSFSMMTDTAVASIRAVVIYFGFFLCADILFCLLASCAMCCQSKFERGEGAYTFLRT